MATLECIVHEYQKELRFLVEHGAVLSHSINRQWAEEDVYALDPRVRLLSHFAATVVSPNFMLESVCYRWRIDIHQGEWWLGLQRLTSRKAWLARTDSWIDARWSGPKFRRHIQSQEEEAIVGAALMQHGPKMLAYIEADLIQHVEKLK